MDSDHFLSFGRTGYMMKATYVIGVILFVSSIAMGQINAQIGPGPNKADGKAILSVDLSKSKKKELRYSLKLRNDVPRAIYYSTTPQDVCGNYGPYVSLDQDNRSVVDIQWRVFHRDIVRSLDCYTNETRVELKRLEPRKTIEVTVSIKWPLSETVPPYLSRRYPNLERSDVKLIRFAIGYFDEEQGILDLLTKKPFGWFTKGDDSLEKVVFQGKRLYEIQQFVSLEVSIPEIKD